MRVDTPFDLSLAISLIKLFQGKTVFDFGCGPGDYVESFRNEGLLIAGIWEGDDPPKIGGASNYRQADLTLPLQLGSMADFVLCLDVADKWPASSLATLAENIDRHARDGIVFSYDPSVRPNADIEALFASMGFETDDAARDDLREAATEPRYQESLMVLRRKVAPASFPAIFVGGPLHRQRREMQAYPDVFVFTPEERDPAAKFGLYSGVQNYRYDLSGGMILDAGQLIPAYFFTK